MSQAKKCTKCLKEKAEAEFWKGRNWCKPCSRAYNRERASKPEVKQKRKEYQKKYMPEYKKKWRKRTDIKLHRVVSWHIKNALDVATRSKVFFSKLGYTIEELKSHLENLFKEDMSWDNYGTEWHIDHVVPRSWTPYASIEDDNFKKCWALSNLQPLWAKDNLSKGDRYAGSPDNIIVFPCG